ncbi:hypothetical protein IM725_18120 [Ramlibacter aquaticus]|uniref:Uncharacterized protein n=1 Tax=Ramlibacter aquaticus TaxID=2780094 RepID=A0ABR9SKD0_9BURK|nr:hypothetical protein [Ramlibacter aquaticus]MBE7942487.1 hypothetical protein [Ramlibacter aquaticus]
MTTKQQAASRMWQSHSEDEVEAIKAQQRAAGDSHHPAQGPPPYGSEDRNLLARDVSSAERERCAQLVESWPADASLGSKEALMAVAAMLRRIV